MNFSLASAKHKVLGLIASLLLPITAWAQQPTVEDLSASSSNSFYQQTQTQPSSGGSLVLFNQVQEHQREIQELRGALEELRHEFERMTRQSQQRYIDLEDRLTQLETERASSAPSEEESAEPAPESRVEPEAAEQVAAAAQSGAGAVSEEAQQAYQAAFSHVQGRRFDDAITAFERFVEEHPESGLTPNGYYWLGELYAANDALATAEEAFNRVINQYSDSRKVPDALYKLGLLKARQGEPERSRELLTRVREEYPQSSAAGLASDFLRQSENLN
ncbi:tol-pal system protein YbgF [Vreelandella massiliensis]|uniref:tol-pal system protein YbgF n=1 Tax=Vreelandella massiliensis TaxID=1816686 RepID=UPI00096A903C|nr:tol-pal system protein YbgF [Halomonas massiliensis]